jgi:hypothetical protein
VEACVNVRRLTSSRRWLVIAVIATLSLSACSARRQVALPPPPALPEVRFVPPCDPSATIGLTEASQRALVARDRALLGYIERLQQMITQGESAEATSP